MTSRGIFKHSPVPIIPGAGRDLSGICRVSSVVQNERACPIETAPFIDAKCVAAVIEKSVMKTYSGKNVSSGSVDTTGKMTVLNVENIVYSRLYCDQFV
jgi:hypothetical protein